MLLLALCLLPVGCTSESSAQDRQDKAMQDPMNYSPYDDKKKVDISGGAINNYDKEGMKRDVDTVFNP